MSEWIKVSDRMPNDREVQEVWAYNGRWVGRLEILGGAFYSEQGGFERGITHWMPIIEPAPPKDGE